MGARGLVVTNAVVMGLRIWWSWCFVQEYLRGVGDRGLDVWEMVPTGGSLAVGCATRWYMGAMLDSRGEGGVEVMLQCVTLVGLCGLGVLLCERRYLLTLLPDAVLERFPASVKRYHMTSMMEDGRKAI